MSRTPIWRAPGRCCWLPSEPEDECGARFLRLRKAVRKSGLKVATVAPFTSNGQCKMNAAASCIAAPAEPGVGTRHRRGGMPTWLRRVRRRRPWGERCADAWPSVFVVVSPSARVLALAWVLRRLATAQTAPRGWPPPGFSFGRGIDEAGAQSLGWGELPGARLDAKQMIEEAASGKLKALVVGGVDVRDFDALPPCATLSERDFLSRVASEVRASEITDRADVVSAGRPRGREERHLHRPGRPPAPLRPGGARDLLDRPRRARAPAEEFDADLG